MERKQWRRRNWGGGENVCKFNGKSLELVASPPPHHRTHKIYTQHTHTQTQQQYNIIDKYPTFSK